MIDVLVPVLRRPQNAEKVFRSLQVTKEPWRLVFICSPKDHEQIAACEALAETLIVSWRPSRGDYARKINEGYRRTDSEWIFQAADDVIFHPGWDTAALRAGARVVGTNDLHNLSVKRGHHSTHSLIARSYIEERGGTVDNSHPVLWEGYDHQFVDSELVEVARRRGEFKHAPDSIVEHFHPYWGNAPRDATYVKAMRQTNADRALYVSRLGRSRTR